MEAAWGALARRGLARGLAARYSELGGKPEAAFLPVWFSVDIAAPLTRNSSSAIGAHGIGDWAVTAAGAVAGLGPV